MTTSRPRFRGFHLYFLLALILSLAQSIHAATINVTANAVDTLVNGNCSLIEAIQAANTDAAVDACTAGSGADTLVVPAGTYALTVVDNSATGENGLPDVITTMTILGAGASATTITRSGATPFRFFHVASTGNLTLNGFTVTNGNSDTGGNDGGAVRNFGVVTLLNSSLENNVATGSGGSAIFSQGASSTLTVTNSLITGNSGSAAIGTCCGGIATITNSTLTANPGGGIDSDNALTVTYSTITDNTGTGVTQGPSAAATLDDTIIANNETNCSGPFTNGGNNLQFPGTDCSAGIATADPLLGPLANNGGNTLTMALLTGSPAIDAGNNALCPGTDQRGILRPQGPICDIGAFELGAGGPPAPTATVPTLSPWMLGLLGIALASFGLFAIRRTP